MPLVPYRAALGGSYTPESPVADVERTVNWYPEIAESPGAVSRVQLYPTPGCRQIDVGTAPGRALFSTAASGGRVFGVQGTVFFEALENGTRTTRGTVASDEWPATISWSGDGGQELFITSGNQGYVYDLQTNTLTTIAALANKARMGGFAYGYFLAFDAATATVYLSALYDGTSWDLTKFFQRNIGADTWQAMLVTSWGQIFLPGSKTRDYYYNAGTSPVPFAPTDSGLQPTGIAAPFSAREVNGMVTWLATTSEGGYSVLAGSGYRADRISTHAVERALASYARVDNAVATAYQHQGHTFYLLSVPSGQVTWVYDFATGLWHERETWRPDVARATAWRLGHHAFAWNRHLWLDRETGSLYETRDDVGTDVDGLAIRRVRQTPPLVTRQAWQYTQRLELLMQTGVGATVDPGRDPQIVLRVSNDGGQTWGHARTASVGQRGATQTRVVWYRLGRARARAYQIVATDPVPYRLVDCFHDVDVAQAQVA